MKILFLNVYYSEFLKKHYANNKLMGLSYMEQWESIQGEMHGDADFYSQGMSKQGWEAHDLITNCGQLQRQWAKENDFSGEEPIWLEQIRRLKPDVVYSHGLWLIDDETKPLVEDSCRLIAGQVGCLVGSFEKHKYDVIFTSIVPYADRFIEAGTPAHCIPLAFDPRVLEQIRPQTRFRPLTYIGGINPAHHGSRQDVINAVASRFEIELLIDKNWGLDMFEIMAQSYITINRNADVETDYIGNMRIYEATGCGALLLTNDGLNMPELFEDDEVLKYNTPEEAVELVDYYLEHREEGELIAERGQKRTLTDHTYEQRMAEIADVLEKML